MLVLVSGLLAAFLSGLLDLGGEILLAPILLYAPQAVGLDSLPVKEIIRPHYGSGAGKRRL